MNRSILNREWKHPEDGWYHIEALGEHRNAAADVTLVIDHEAVEAIVNRFQEEASKPGFAGVLVDAEHFSHDPDKATTAYGWLQELQAREDGLYARIRWTNTGQTAVDGADYRFFSTEYDRRQARHLGGKRFRPLSLDGLTLTNRPNNRGQKPITNRRDAGASTADTPTTLTQKRSMKSVATRLGLSADASEESMLEAVVKIINRAETAEKELVPVKNRVTELETENKNLLEAQVETDLTLYKNRIKPGSEEGWRKRLIANRADTIEILEELDERQEGGTGAKPTGQKVLNRANAGTPQPSGAAVAKDPEAQAKEANDAITDYQLQNKCSYSAARDIIRNRRPELFGLPTA